MGAFPGIRDFVFDPLSGMSLLVAFSKKDRNGMVCRQSCIMSVNLPLVENLSSSHPHLIERLEADWGKQLSSLECSTHDFRRALHEGTSLGHVWAELYSLILDKLATKLRFDHIGFREEVVRLAPAESDAEDFRVIYQVTFAYKALLPRKVQALVGQVVYLVSGYLNACIEGEVFPIHYSINEMVRYRLYSRRRRSKRTNRHLLVPVSGR